jgi:phosphoglucomutase
MTMRQALDEAMQGKSTDDAIRTLVRRGVWIADEDAMTDAVHKVYCGMIADHEHPNEKDRQQAKQLIAAVGEAIGTGS